MAFNERLAERIRQALGDRPDVTEKRMFGGLAFLYGGRMCCGVTGHDLVVRVMASELPNVMTHPHVRPMDFTGRPLRGFVYVSPGGYKTAAALQRWIDRGLRFVESDEAPRAARTRTRRKSG